MTPTLLAPFAAWVARDAERPAASFGGRTLTYGQLDRRATDIATHLLRAGVVPGNLVGLCVERSTDLVAAILGVLKAGAAYLPLDPAYPSERLTRIAAISSPVAILAERHSAHLLPASPAMVWLDEIDRAAPGVDPEQLPWPTLDPSSLAYVLFTSGSTGQPKGVPIEHGQVRWFFSAAQERFGFGEHEVWSQFHSCGFDISVLEIFGALLFGGRVAIPPQWVCRQPDAFLDFLAQERVTVLNQTPSAFWPLAEADDGRALALRWVIFVGEALDVRRLRGWYARRGDRQPTLVNMYGITETTVNAMFRSAHRRRYRRPDRESDRQTPSWRRDTRRHRGRRTRGRRRAG